MKKLIILSVFLLSYFPLFGAGNLKLQHPQLWQTDYGTIDEMVITVKPEGLMAEIGVYLVISTRKTYFENSQDSIEAILNFNLNENCFINDSWLWIEDYISHAYLIDKSKAINIYENIVKRRRDPSLLIKNNKTNYQINIYPLKCGSFRKIKISYMAPFEFTSSGAKLDLPLEILRESKAAVNKVQIKLINDADFKNPYLTGGGKDFTFTNEYDPEYFTDLNLDINYQDGKEDMKLVFDSPMKEGIYFNTSTEKQENYYQFAIDLSPLSDFVAPKKQLILIDYESGKTELVPDAILEHMKNNLKDHLSERDSFNIIFSNLNTTLVSEKWLPATPDVIDSIFQIYNFTYVPSYSFLTSAIFKSLEFLKANGGGTLNIFGGSDDLMDINLARDVFKKAASMIDSSIVVNAFDMAININSIYYNNKYYLGNELFYTNLTNLTSGKFMRKLYNNTTIQLFLDKAFTASMSNFSNIEIYSSTDDGFCLGRYKILNTSSENFFGSTYSEIGKFIGTLPIEVRITGFCDNKPFVKKVTIDDSQFEKNNYRNRQIWNGNHINYLETQVQENATVQSIVQTSLRNRILSLYTAFLALEEKDTIPVSNEKGDKETTPVKEGLKGIDDEIQISPNPLTSSSKISLNIGSISNEYIKVKIISAIGEVVKEFEQLAQNSEFSFTWNGDNSNGEQLPAGMYIIVIETKNKVISKKIMILRK